MTLTMERPARPTWLPEDAYEAAPEGPDWSTVSFRIAGKRCRRRGCENQAVAALDRHNIGGYGHGLKRPLWYAYCGEHLYGRWVEDGRVMSWRVRQDWDDVPDPASGEPRVVERET